MKLKVGMGVTIMRRPVGPSVTDGCHGVLVKKYRSKTMGAWEVKLDRPIVQQMPPAWDGTPMTRTISEERRDAYSLLPDALGVGTHVWVYTGHIYGLPEGFPEYIDGVIGNQGVVDCKIPVIYVDLYSKENLVWVSPEDVELFKGRA